MPPPAVLTAPEGASLISPGAYRATSASTPRLKSASPCAPGRASVFAAGLTPSSFANSASAPAWNDGAAGAVGFPDYADDLKARIRAIAEELDAHRKARQAEHPKLTLTQIYNVLEILRAAPGGRLPAGESPGAIEEFERIKAEGLVLILKELHDTLDALVFEAYGWPADLTDEDILARLVDLNKQRALEEKVGKVKWLRPDYQIPRFGSDAERARLEDERRKARDDEKIRPRQDVLDLDDDLREMAPADAAKPKFSTGNELAETADVMRVLATSPEPISIPRIASTFAQGKAIEKRVALTVLALARLGHLASPDGGDTFTLRRVG